MNVRLEQLKLAYFKGARDLEINFRPDGTSVYGDNGTGKTTIFDAFIWVLFGKDSIGQKDTEFSIKTLNPDNSVIPGVEHEVEATIYVDGRRVILRRVLKENWVKKQGTPLAVLTGNTTVCYFDGVPVLVGEYNRRIADIMPEMLFRLVTSPLYFNKLHWTERRKVLINMAGSITDADIVALNPEFANIVAGLNGKSMADFKARIGAEKKAINDVLKMIPTRIDQTRKNMPAEVDFTAIETEIAELETKVTGVDTQIGNTAESYKVVNDRIQETNKKINALKTEQNNIMFAAVTAEQKRVHDANETRRELEYKKSSAEMGMLRIDRDIKSAEQVETSARGKITEMGETLTTLRAEWTEINAREYIQGEGVIICPLYGHGCSDNTATDRYAESQEKAKTAFYDNVTVLLTKNNTRGVSLSAELKQLNADLITATLLKDNSIIAKGEAENELTDINNLLKNTPVAEPAQLLKEMNLDWVELQDEINGLQSTTEQPPVIDNTALNAEKRGYREEIDRLKKVLYNRELIATGEKTITDLQAKQQLQAQQIADLEAQEFEAKNFVKCKMGEVENRINGMFKYVTFKMFETTYEGNENEICTTLVHGIPYDSMNSAARINAGIDIINAISASNGVSAPIFIDNRESVNTLVKTGAQIVNLFVTADKELIIK